MRFPVFPKITVPHISGQGLASSRRVLVAIISALAFSPALLSQPMSDEQILNEIKEMPYRSACCYCPYNGGEFRDTPAPKGYKAFYVSHLSRHGSRYQEEAYYKYALADLDTLHKAGLLTAVGDTIRNEIRLMASITQGHDMLLTDKGAREHTQIARNLTRRCPEVFRQKDRRIAAFTSTGFHRTLQSLAGFEAGILSFAPDLDCAISSRFYTLDFKRDTAVFIPQSGTLSVRNKIEKELQPSSEEFARLRSLLLADEQAAKPLVRGEDLDLFVQTVFKSACTAGTFDIKLDPLRFFTPQELLTLYKLFDIRFNAMFGVLESSRAKRSAGGVRWARMIVDEADKAIEGNGHCADFRFAHDGNVGPMMNLLAIGPFQYTSSEKAPYRNWQSYRYICMASNLQLIFYRNRKEDDILVKALYNEREIDFPGLKAINGVYYRWTDARRYIVSRTDDVKEVPPYYSGYLEDKAAQIRTLQADEAEGFYFWTDSHYPANFGNTPALIESLEHSAGRRPVVFGGDVITYLNYMDDGIARQISAIEQIRGAAAFYWVRGNHDFVNYTGRKPYITQDRKALEQWSSAELMSRYTSSGTVKDPGVPYSSYYYVDNPEAKIRNIVFETNDKVIDNKVTYDVSDSQLQWIIENAVLGAPNGWKLLFFSHVPPADSKDASIGRIAGLLSSIGSHSKFNVGGTAYDFSARGDLAVIGIICGHKHRDYHKDLGGGVLQINVAADCNYTRQQEGGTTKEQSFEYFSISKDYKTIRTVKIGDGQDRTFKLLSGR